MKINIAAQHMKLGVSIQEYVRDTIEEIVNKYLEKYISVVDVHFVKNRRDFSTDIIMHESSKFKFKLCGHASSNDPYSAFDAAVNKIEKQLRKYKEKIKDYHAGKDNDVSYKKVAKYVIDPYQEEETGPAIISQSQESVPVASVAEAVMYMDMQDVPAFLFINSNTGRLNMVYYRKDNNISWVDPDIKE